MELSVKLFFSLFAVVLTVVGFIPYVLGILNGKTKPHAFSWLIWGITTFIVFLAQLEDGGGVGAWAIGLSGVVTVFVAALAYLKRGDASITRTDWLFLIIAVLSLPVWYITANPLWAVVILTGVDLLGFGPTFRKAYVMPSEESVLFFSLVLIRNTAVIVALENYSLTTVLFPLAIAIGCGLLVSMVLWRRRVLRVS